MKLTSADKNCLRSQSISMLPLYLTSPKRTVSTTLKQHAGIRSHMIPTYSLAHLKVVLSSNGRASGLRKSGDLSFGYSKYTSIITKVAKNTQEKDKR